MRCRPDSTRLQGVLLHLGHIAREAAVRCLKPNLLSTSSIIKFRWPPRPPLQGPRAQMSLVQQLALQLISWIHSLLAELLVEPLLMRLCTRIRQPLSESFC